MNKIDKKKNKLKERILEMEEKLTSSLTKKDSNTKEINVSLHLKNIQDLKIELFKLK